MDAFAGFDFSAADPASHVQSDFRAARLAVLRVADLALTPGYPLVPCQFFDWCVHISVIVA
jgi:hypothetical protein